MVAGRTSQDECRRVNDWNSTETIVLLALLIGVLLGTFSGYTLALDHYDFQVDNVVSE